MAFGHGAYQTPLAVDTPARNGTAFVVHLRQEMPDSNVRSRQIFLLIQIMVGICCTDESWLAQTQQIILAPQAQHPLVIPPAF